MKKIIIYLIILFSSISNANAQIMWDLRAGVSYTTFEESGDAFYYMGELGIDIPLKNNFAIQGSLRYKNIFHVDTWEKDKFYWDELSDKTRANLLELPILFGYKFPLNERSNLRIAAGPYASAGLDNFSIYQAGISTGINYEYRMFNVGMNYNLALHKPYDNMANNGVFLTVGIKFKSSAWKSIGSVAAVIGGTALVAGAAISETSSNQTSSDSDYSEYDSANDISTDTSSKNQAIIDELKEKEKKTGKQARYLTTSYSADSQAYDGFNNQLRNMKYNKEKFVHLSVDQYCKEVKDIQRKMKRIREKITNGGGTKPKSELESWNPCD